jgi:hypothetical protein
MQKAPQSILINELTKNEANRAYENFIEEIFGSQTENNDLIVKLQVVGYEVIELVFAAFNTPEFTIELQMSHEGVVLSFDISNAEYEKLSALFDGKKVTVHALKIRLIADEIQSDRSAQSLQFLFESKSLYRAMSNNRIETLKRYFKTDRVSKLKAHDSF